MNKIEITKKVVSLVVGLGTTKIVNDIVENNTNTERVTDKVAVKAGSVVIGSMVADKTSEYTDTKIDEMAAWWRENVTNRKPTEN